MDREPAGSLHLAASGYTATGFRFRYREVWGSKSLLVHYEAAELAARQVGASRFAGGPLDPSSTAGVKTAMMAYAPPWQLIALEEEDAAASARHAQIPIGPSRTIILGMVGGRKIEWHAETRSQVDAKRFGCDRLRPGWRQLIEQAHITGCVAQHCQVDVVVRLPVT